MPWTGNLPRLRTGIIGAWLLSLLIVGLTTFTSLEFVPLPLANGPRWLSWGLTFPACYFLQTGWSKLRWLWVAFPWLLWGPLVVVQGLYLLLAVGHDHPGNWTRALEPVRTLFLRPQSWHTQRVLFQRGTQVVVVQRLQLSSFRPRYARTAKLTPLLPGLQ